MINKVTKEGSAYIRTSCTRWAQDTECKSEAVVIMRGRKGKSERMLRRRGAAEEKRMESRDLSLNRERNVRERPVNMWYSNMAFSNVKHKKQSCRTCRTTFTQTLVSLYGFSVMFLPLGKDICNSFYFSFVFVFLLF